MALASRVPRALGLIVGLLNSVLTTMIKKKETITIL